MILVLPYQARFSARSVPVITLALIVVNALVFFFAQARDDAAYDRALDYYEQSSLPRIELQRYRAWLARQTKDASARKQLSELQSALAEKDIGHAVALMQSDDNFMRALVELLIVPPEDAEFLTWRDQRNRFDSLLKSSATDRFLLERAAMEPWRFVSYQFLHGDLGHWLGNMIVLLLAGPFAEAALGRRRFLAGYLLAGAAAGALHLALSDAALIGASGAIAGAMAMVAVLYRLRRVPVFVWVLFYIDTVRMPALALLPIWIANELWQWAADPDAGIAYVAHLGGFIVGALLAWWLGPRDAANVERALAVAADADAGERPRLRLEQRAQQAAAQLDTARAAKLYAELAAQYPKQVDYAIASFNLAVLGKDRDALRDAAVRVLTTRSKRSSPELRRAYLHMAQPRALEALSIDERLRLARRLVRAREDAAALQLIDTLLTDAHVRAEHARALSDCLLALFTTYTRHGLAQQADDVQRRLRQYFAPDVLQDAAPPATPTTDSGPSTLNFDLPSDFHTAAGSSRAK